MCKTIRTAFKICARGEAPAEEWRSLPGMYCEMDFFLKKNVQMSIVVSLIQYFVVELDLHRFFALLKLLIAANGLLFCCQLYISIFFYN